MENLLTEHVAVVTGGNAGIGKACAHKLAEQDARVVIFGTNAERGAATVKEINGTLTGETVTFMQVDVSDTTQVEEAIKTVVNEHGGVDILVNNAGITRDNLLVRMSEEEWNSVIGVNLKSCYNTCHAVMRPMIKARRGKVINISSVSGLVGHPGQTNYAASKAGMIGFSKSLAREVASRNICVNCVAPGFIETRMTEELSDKQKEAAVQQIPMGRMGVPNDIANMVLFLASSLSEYITGQVFVVDGGMAM